MPYYEAIQKVTFNLFNVLQEDLQIAHSFIFIQSILSYPDLSHLKTKRTTYFPQLTCVALPLFSFSLLEDIMQYTCSTRHCIVLTCPCKESSILPVQLVSCCTIHSSGSRALYGKKSYTVSFNISCHISHLFHFLRRCFLYL